jgi:uncharacterized damage-inducible protein DinB
MSTPEDTRPEPSTVADERTLLDGFLDYHRATLLWKCAELSDDDLRRRTVEPSSLSLLGLVRHLTEVELGWFVHGFAGEEVTFPYSSPDNRDGDFDDVDRADAKEAFANYQAAIARCKAAVADAPLDAQFTSKRTGKTFSLRWVYLHMIEEYARHNGHADLLRERIDGAVGD